MRLLIPLILLAACTSGANPARDAVDAQKAAEAARTTPAAAVGETWSCPMHPEVSETQAGKCPKCGMDLVKKGS